MEPPVLFYSYFLTGAFIFEMTGDPEKSMLWLLILLVEISSLSSFLYHLSSDDGEENIVDEAQCTDSRKRQLAFEFFKLSLQRALTEVKI